MTEDGWPAGQPLFNKYELSVQDRFGLAEGSNLPFRRRNFRTTLPPDQIDTFPTTRYIAVGTTGPGGEIWATIIDGVPGFITCPDPKELHIRSPLLDIEPLASSTQCGAPFGTVTVDLGTRRRYRMNGHVSSKSGDHLVIGIDQAFVNCPQFIQTRDLISEREVSKGDFDVTYLTSLGPAEVDLIQSSDTMFIASGIAGGDGDPTYGNDASYRGGKPGFVRIDDERTLTIPDFVGNFLFNTIGNLIINSNAGLLFIDFENGAQLNLTGTIEILWDGDKEAKAFAGAQRLLRFTLSRGVFARNTLTNRWRLREFSPQIAYTGTWEEARRNIAAAQKDKQEYIVSKIVDEAEGVRSFYLKPKDGLGLPAAEPGQFLPVQIDGPNGQSIERMYSLSNAPSGQWFRITVKRVVGSDRPGAGKGSNWLHDRTTVGSTLTCSAPRGQFTPKFEQRRPLALISFGIGITPMMSITHAVLGTRTDRTTHMNRIHFVTSARNGRGRLFKGELDKLWNAHAPGNKNNTQLATLTIHRVVSRPDQEDRKGVDFDHVGRIDADLLSRVLPPADYDYFICGPDDAMNDLVDGLLDKGISSDRIHTELFGSRRVHKRVKRPGAEDLAERVPVMLTRQGKAVDWTEEDDTLLDFAEANGLHVNYGCRVGVCGTCKGKLISGEITYIRAPGVELDEGEILLCCAIPAKGTTLELDL